MTPASETPAQPEQEAEAPPFLRRSLHRQRLVLELQGSKERTTSLLQAIAFATERSAELNRRPLGPGRPSE